MLKKITLLSTCLFFLAFSGCELLEGVELPDTELSESEIIDGLKEALKVGTDTAVTQLTKVNGFYSDAVIKILLPEEASSVITKLNSTTAGKAIYDNALKPTVEKLIQSLNKSAEDAAVKAKPIFVNAITGITISDGINILQGSDTAATSYLKSKTYSDLKTAFTPDINTSLEKPLVASQSCNTIWNSFVTTYNTTANSPFNSFLDLDPIEDTNLASFVTGKALDGLFYKVGLEEKAIREDPVARVTEILEKVFGSL